MTKKRIIFSFKKEDRSIYLAVPKIDFGKECICCNKKTLLTFGFQTYGGTGSTYTLKPIPKPLCENCQDHIHPDHISFFIPLGLVIGSFITICSVVFGTIYSSGFFIIFGLSFFSMTSLLYWRYYLRPLKSRAEGHFPLTRFIVYKNTFVVVSKNEALIVRLQNLNRGFDLDIK